MSFPSSVRIVAMLAAVLIPGVAAADEPAMAVADDNPLLALATLTYQPKDLAKGNLRIAGSEALQQAAAFWCEGLELIHPDMAWGIDTGTSEDGWEKLVAGKADVALVDRPLTDAELAAWAAAQQQAAAARRLATIAVGFREDHAGEAGVGDTETRVADADEHVRGDVRPASHHPLYAIVAVPADGPWPPVLEEFVSYVLSFSGQIDVAKDGLLPLSRGEIHAQTEALGWTIER
jgi:ABC-type phosphate transport system substrate-binding protein